jgi:hypothetical protein
MVRQRLLRPSDRRPTRQHLTLAYSLHTLTFTMNSPLHCADFEIRFDNLFQVGRWLAFPCDASGHVDIDALSERARVNYLYARAMIGREYSAPSLLQHALAPA